MADGEIRFTDGAAYERFMGKWSRIAGDAFLDWLAPKSGLNWLDVGCGNGAFTELLIQRCEPSGAEGIDPSEAQLTYARQRCQPPTAQFRQGDAMALPFADGTFDVAVMPLVIFFVPQPARGVAEMARVVRSGGVVSAYGWAMLDGGFPYDALWEQMRSMGVEVPLPPSPDASRINVMRGLWSGAGVIDIDDYWATVLGGPSVTRGLASMSVAELNVLQLRMRECLPADGSGHIVVSARANAIKGRVAG